MWWFLSILAACGPNVLGPSAIEAGDYQFHTHTVHDACLDGALSALFMPEGRDTPHPFEFPIYVPTVEETPLSYEIDLREPFLGMPVTVEESADGLAVRGGVMESVLLDEGQYGDCTARMGVDVDLWPSARRHLAGEARLDLSDLHGAEERCPALEADPCQVTLALTAEWLEERSPPAAP